MKFNFMILSVFFMNCSGYAMEIMTDTTDIHQKQVADDNVHAKVIDKFVCYTNGKCDRQSYHLTTEAPITCDEKVANEPRVYNADIPCAEGIRYGLDAKVAVYCSTFDHCYCDLETETREALAAARKEDVLLILQSGDSDKFPVPSRLMKSKEEADNNRADFPNIILTAACCWARCCDEEVDVWVEPVDNCPGSAARIVADLVSQLRHAKPHLSALQTKELFLTTLGKRVLNYKTELSVNKFYQLLCNNADEL